MVIRKTIKKARAKLKPMALSILWEILVWISRNAPQLFFPCKEYKSSEFKNSSTFQRQNDHVLNMRLISIWGTGYSNRKFPSSCLPLFQSESKCEAILVKMTLICMKMKRHAQLIFIWKVSHLDSFCSRGTRIFEWPIDWLIN